MGAAGRGHSEVVKVLLEAGAHVNMRDKVQIIHNICKQQYTFDEHFFPTYFHVENNVVSDIYNYVVLFYRIVFIFLM